MLRAYNSSDSIFWPARLIVEIVGKGAINDDRKAKTYQGVLSRKERKE
jgi:hypothetical protein